MLATVMLCTFNSESYKDSKIGSTSYPLQIYVQFWLFICPGTIINPIQGNSSESQMRALIVAEILLNLPVLALYPRSNIDSLL